MNINEFKFVIASLPDRENCVCEIFYDGGQWAEISQENQEILIQFYPHPYKQYWEIPIDLALEALSKGKKIFIGS